MLLSQLRRVLSWLSKISRDRKVLVLLGILALGAYLRLWKIQHLFNVLHDYDEGAYSLGARFISQGLLPYQDFTLVHPPLYDLVLASVYKIFGYSFFDGRYLSIALSLACIVLIYLVGKKMYHSTAGLVAAALFAVSPGMVYFGRRVVQETMGIFLILLAIYFAIDFIQSRKKNRAFLCGLALGLAVATKYLFIPAVVAIIMAIILLTMRERFWQSIKTLGRPALWIMYLCFAAIFYSLVLLLRWSLKLAISIPFIDPMYLSVSDVAITILVFLLPLVISLAILGRNLAFKQWWFGLWELRQNRGVWLLLGGTVLGFIVITGFFWVKAPQEFLSQTVLLQQNRPGTEFPSLVGIIRVILLTPDFLRMAALPILFGIPLVFVLLNKQDFSKSDCFLSVTLVVSLVLCQGLYHMPRYYASVFPFLFLGISLFMPPLDVKMLTAKLKIFSTRFKTSLVVVSSVFLIFVSVTIVLLTNYTGYDVLGVGLPSKEEQLYKETSNYLKGAGAKKVYAINPIFPALSPNLDSSLAFDTFALLWLEEKPPAEIIKEAKEEGVDYIILDPWAWYWSNPYKEEVGLVQEVRRNARLMRVIEPDSPCRTEIYLLGAEAQGVFNGDFAQWVTTDEISLPLGWDSVIVTGKGDKTVIEETYIAGVKCAGFTIYEDGLQEDNRDSIHAGISQEIPFPESKLRVQVFPTVNTRTAGSVVLGPSIHFVDSQGHALIIGFSDEVDEEEVFQYEDGSRILVVKNAQLRQWSEHTIDLSAYWKKANWRQPEEIEIYLLISTYYSEPGYYALYVAKVEAEGAKVETVQ
jgi:4-amino-4-deoxy-L-arabinose transferase-like glycosyltransferase